MLFFLHVSWPHYKHYISLLHVILTLTEETCVERPLLKLSPNEFRPNITQGMLGMSAAEMSVEFLGKVRDIVWLMADEKMNTAAKICSEAKVQS